MKQVLLGLLSLLLSALAGSAAAACLTDTAQADFLAGVPASVDLTTSPGNVLLTKMSGGGGTLDQQNTTISIGWNFSDTHWVGQTFTPSRSGALTEIDLEMFCNNCTSAKSVTVSVQATSGGLPSGQDLAVATLTIGTSGLPAWSAANFASPANVSAGTQYAIVIRSTSVIGLNFLYFSVSAKSANTGNDVYPGGALISNGSGGSSWSIVNTSPTSDGAFKTYVGGSSGYARAGDLISSPKDSNPGTGTTNWSTLSWTNAALPAGTSLRFQAAGSNSSGGPFNFVGPDGTANSFFTTTNAPLDRFNGNRFLKYRAFLGTDNTAATPTLNDATVCFTTASSPDLAITNSDGASMAHPGGTVVYAITASNPGPSGISGATVADAFPSTLVCNWTCAGANGATCPASGSGNINSLVNLPGGTSVTFTATCAVSVSASGSISNTATITPPSGVVDPNTANNTATDTDSIAIATAVRLAITDNVDTAEPGDALTYIITLTNAGPSYADITGISDALPAQLSSPSWICSATPGATCKSASGNTLNNQSATVPPGGTVTYHYSATVGNITTEQFTNTVTATVSAGDPTPNKSASDTDKVSLFANGFETGQTLAVYVGAANGGSESFAMQLGVDAGLLGQLEAAPVTIARGRSADGKNLFSVQIARGGSDIIVRTVANVGDGKASEVSPWRRVDLKQHVIGLAWQSASASGGDGYLDVAIGNSQLAITGRNETAAISELQIAVDGDIPWLVPIEP